MKPTAIGPQSRTVIGAVAPSKDTSPSVASLGKKPPEKPTWKKLLLPAGIAGAVFLALRYKGHV